MGFYDCLLLLTATAGFSAHRIARGGLGTVKHAQLTTSAMLSTPMLGHMRLGIGLFQIILLVTRIAKGPFSTMCNDDVSVCIPYGGVWILSTFTMWCWVAQGVYFVLSGLVTLGWLRAPNNLVFSLSVLYEVQLCVSLLVTLAVSFLLVPMLEWKLSTFKGPARQLESLRNRQAVLNLPFAVLVHTANLWLMLLELSCNRIPFQTAHFPFVLLWATLYAFFGWAFFHLHGIWYYFFLDYRRPFAALAYAGLMMCLVLFFRLASVVTSVKGKHGVQRLLFYLALFLSVSSVLLYVLKELARQGKMHTA
mmetsp:Transcript_18890/g.47665  ORF Transcript_18890/g.47665 Transcript_18890/m.47665 type:complete len:307 (-) Transcript_18890:11-931(-)